ncbi:MAG: type II toxin-antitoxin system HipA family toxin [Spirochaetia bacterium]|nr:type II toxin-antitoxin system HipA family toxin [Spirochaetia bacterium]
MAQKTLSIWMNGERVGTWSLIHGSSTLNYDADWVSSPASRALSLSLPFVPGNRPHTGKIVDHFFDNLLPDNETIRGRIQSRYGVGKDAFSLLSSIGRDCVGALQLLPGDELPGDIRRVTGRALDEAGIERLLRNSLAGGALSKTFHDDDLRISLAGAQEKTALLYHRGRWRLPTGATPTTHILKFPLGVIGGQGVHFPHSVENEWLCLRIMHHIGFAVPACEVLKFGEFTVLSVRRFDRREQDGWIARLPQEDFCQALGLPSHKKYEADGGPGILEVLRVLEGSSQAEADRAAFFRAQMAFFLLAAPDGHAKNFSIHLTRGGGYRLTPFYDVMSLWPYIGSGNNQVRLPKVRLAMALRSKNAHSKILEIMPRHWDAVSTRAGLGSSATMREEMATQVPAAIKEVERELPPGFPEALFEKVIKGMRENSKRLVSRL